MAKLNGKMAAGAGLGAALLGSGLLLGCEQREPPTLSHETFPATENFRSGLREELAIQQLLGISDRFVDISKLPDPGAQLGPVSLDNLKIAAAWGESVGAISASMREHILSEQAGPTERAVALAALNRLAHDPQMLDSLKYNMVYDKFKSFASVSPNDSTAVFNQLARAAPLFAIFDATTYASTGETRLILYTENEVSLGFFAQALTWASPGLGYMPALDKDSAKAYWDLPLSKQWAVSLSAYLDFVDTDIVSDRSKGEERTQIFKQHLQSALDGTPINRRQSKVQGGLLSC